MHMPRFDTDRGKALINEAGVNPLRQRPCLQPDTIERLIELAQPSCDRIWRAFDRGLE